MSAAANHADVDPSFSRTSPSPSGDRAHDPSPDPSEPHDHAGSVAQESLASDAVHQTQATAVFPNSVADDVKALTAALTTPISASTQEQESAAAAVVAAVGAAVAVGPESGPSAEQVAQPEPSTTLQPTTSSSASSPTFDVSHVDSLSPAAQDELVRNQAAKTLQLIALSLSGPTTQSAEQTELVAPEPIPEPVKAAPVDPAWVSLEQVLREHAAATTRSVPESPASLGTASSKPEDDVANALAQVVLKAMQADAMKTTPHSLENESTDMPLATDNPPSTVDDSEIHKVNVDPTSTTEGAIANGSSSGTNTTQGFTFELDKATGKTHIKWTNDTRADPKENVNSVLESASAFHLALQTLLAGADLQGLSELNLGNNGLLAPSTVQFPAQGSEFGSAQGPVAEARSETTSTAPPRKKRKTGGSSKQNTAASIPEGAPSFPCTFPGCEKVFARLYNLKSHSRTHTDERPFVCSNCDLAFSRNHDLRRHVKIHLGDKVFRCEGCSKSFSRLDALGRHRNNAKNKPACQAPAPVPT